MNNLIDDVKMAAELEKKGYDFYSATAAKTNNPLASATLNGLAARELAHIDKIKEFYRDLTGEKKLPADWLRSVDVPPGKAELLRPILDRLKSSLERELKKEKDVNDAYLVAEGLERDSYNLYDRIAKENNEEITKKFFTALAAEEREHFSILEDTMQYLDNPGEWYRKTEHWIVEG